MRIISVIEGVDIQYEGTALVLECRDENAYAMTDSPADDYVDIVAYGPYVPRGRMKVGTYSDYECAELALDMISDAFADGMKVIGMPTMKEMDCKIKNQS